MWRPSKPCRLFLASEFMVLPIIVPAWDFGWQYRDQGGSVLPSKRSLPRSPKKLQLAAGTTECAAPAPTEREMLIMQWRRIANVRSPRKTAAQGIASTNRTLATAKESEDCGGSLLATCEWLLRKRLRQDWALMCRGDRAQTLALVSRFKRDSPIVNNSDLAVEAAAWTLFAMYWCGASHPAALFHKSLHPPTGLVRWISQFHVEQQSTQVRDIQGQFAHYLDVTRGRCDVLIRRMMKRAGSVALLQELCDF